MACPNFKNRPKTGLRPLGINYILEEKYSSTIYALTFRAQKIRHVLHCYIPLLECIYEVHLIGIVALTLDRNYVEWRWYSRPFLDGLGRVENVGPAHDGQAWRTFFWKIV